MKRTLLIAIGVIVAAAGFWYFTQPSEEAAGTPSNHQYSQGSTGVILIEYGDFQCPACAQYYPIVKQVKELYKDRVTFQFRHFPLEAIHVNARAGSRAAEAAGLQGKFWEMHDQLYENQNAWESVGDPLSIFTSYARAVGVADIDKFLSDYRSSTVNATINADLAEGKNIGATATPTFVLDGKKLEELPIPSVEAFSALLDEAIAAKTGTQTNDAAGGTEPTQLESTTPEETTPAQ